MNTKQQSLLWEISNASQEHKSYVLGTMHVRDARAFKYLNVIQSRILSCSDYAAEFDLKETEETARLSHMELDQGIHLNELIPEKKYKKLQRMLFKAFQLDISLFNNLRPIFISNLIAESVLSKDKKLPLDSYLWEFADAQNKNLHGIETYEEQQTILHSIPIDYQLKSLIDIGRNVKKYRQQILKLTNYYENLELNKLYKSSKNSLGKLKRLLLYNRNELMAQRIGRLVDKHATFCSIGAGHLSGNRGVLRLLKKKGYSLQPIRLV